MSTYMYATVDSTTGEKRWAPPVTYQILPDDDAILGESVLELGGVHSDYLIYTTDDLAIMTRLLDGDIFEGVIESGVVTSLDFSLEDGLPQIEVTSDVTGDEIRLYDDMTFDTLIITARILNADNTVDTSFNEEYFVKINSAGHIVPTYTQFTNGVVSFQFKPQKHGYYTMPIEDKKTEDGRFRVKSQLNIMVYYKAA